MTKEDTYRDSMRKLSIGDKLSVGVKATIKDGVPPHSGSEE